MANTTDKLYEIFAAIAPDTSPLTSASNQLADSFRNTAQQATTSGSSQSTAGEVLDIAKTVLESGLGVIPLVAGLVGLFTGGNDPAPPPLVKYAMPAKLSFQGADTAQGVSEMDYDQYGTARPLASAASAPAAPQITVNVQAMDSRSFLDHSGEIAQAVRDAMLNLSSLNDVVSNL